QSGGPVPAFDLDFRRHPMSPQVGRSSPGRAHVRSLGTLALAGLLFLLLTALAHGVRAQSPPGHPHQWEAGDPIPTPIVEAGGSTLRPGELVRVSVANLGAEADHCANPDGCPFYANTALDPLHVSAWSDGGRGGAFAYVDS